jgi:pimeloyl-ACP methyl ester carboxylesterase
VLFIPGATGDGGHFDAVASEIEGEFLVVTYDRRGNSRSARPDDWSRTSTDEQADDAAALLGALGLAPAALFATSGGAIIGLNLLLRHPAVVTAAIFHEPPLISVLSEPGEAMAAIRAIIEPAMAAGGPRGAVEAFVRFAAGDAASAIAPELRERMLNNGETLVGVEFGVFESYRPDDAALAAVAVPVQVMAGRDTMPFLRESSAWLAGRLRVPVVPMPGGHAPYFDQPRGVAEAIRPFLRRVADGGKA